MCDSCSRPDCPGVGSLRHFTDWRDLSDHLDEAQLVFIVNRYVEIFDEWKLLSEREAERRFNARKRANEQRALMKVARELLTEDELATIKSRSERRALIEEEFDEREDQQHEDSSPRSGDKPTLVTRGKGGRVLHVSVVQDGPSVGGKQGGKK